jgi:hypothetical protein
MEAPYRSDRTKQIGMNKYKRHSSKKGDIVYDGNKKGI